MNFLLKLSVLNSDFTLPLGYLNLALNNPAQGSNVCELRSPWAPAHYKDLELLKCKYIKLSKSWKNSK